MKKMTLLLVALFITYMGFTGQVSANQNAQYRNGNEFPSADVMEFFSTNPSVTAWKISYEQADFLIFTSHKHMVQSVINGNSSDFRSPEPFKIYFGDILKNGVLVPFIGGASYLQDRKEYYTGISRSNFGVLRSITQVTNYDYGVGYSDWLEDYGFENVTDTTFDFYFKEPQSEIIDSYMVYVYESPFRTADETKLVEKFRLSYNGDKQRIFRQDGLKPDTWYTVSVHTVRGNWENQPSYNAVRSTKTFSTGSPRLQLQIGGKTVLWQASNYLQEFGEITLQQQKYTNIIVSVNSHEVYNGSASDIKIPIEKYTQHLRSGKQNELKVVAARSPTQNDTFMASIVKIGEYIPAPNEPGIPGVAPEFPQPPENPLDIPGTIKWGFDVIKYMWDTIAYFFSQLSTTISNSIAGATSFFAVITAFFSWLPPQVNAVLLSAIIVSIVARIFGR